MRTSLKIIILTSFLFFILFNGEAFAQRKKNPVRVLLVTGGHGFDREPFYKFMSSLSGITFTEVRHPNALSMFRPENRDLYDVVLFYDMPEAISEQEKKDFIDCLNAGKGIVVLHHAYCSYQGWAEYQNIIGGRYHQNPWTDSNGVVQPASNYQYNIDIRVRVVNRKHPITKGIRDFNIIDETYGNGSVNSGVHVLLATNEPTSTPSLAWTNHYGNSKVVTILLGHDNRAWTNKNFAKLVRQAIIWAK